MDNYKDVRVRIRVENSTGEFKIKAMFVDMDELQKLEDRINVIDDKGYRITNVWNE